MLRALAGVRMRDDIALMKTMIAASPSTSPPRMAHKIRAGAGSLHRPKRAGQRDGDRRSPRCRQKNVGPGDLAAQCGLDVRPPGKIGANVVVAVGRSAPYSPT